MTLVSFASWPGRAVLVPIRGPEQPILLRRTLRDVDQSLRALTRLHAVPRRSLRQSSLPDKPKFMGHRRCSGGTVDTNQMIPRGATALLGPPARRVRANCQ